MHLVRAVGNAQHAGVGIQRGQREIFRQAGATVHLHRRVDHLRRHVRRHHLDLRNFAHRAFNANGIHHPRGFQRQQPCLFDGHAGIGDHVDIAAELGQRLAESDTGHGAFAHQFQRVFGGTDGAHAVVDAAWAKAALRNLEATSRPGDERRQRQAHIGEADFAVAVRLVQRAEHRQHALDFHPRRVQRHQHHRVLLVFIGVRIGEAHEDRHFAVRVANAGAPPFAAVQHHFVAFDDRGGLHIGGIAGRHARLGHAERRADGAVEQGFEPARLLLFRAVFDQHFHIAGVGRVAVEHFRRNHRTAGDFRQRRVIDIRQAVAIFRLGQEQVPQSGGLGLGFQLFHHRRLVPPGPVCTTLELLEIGFFGRNHVLVHERGHTFDGVAGGGGMGKIHVQSPFAMASRIRVRHKSIK